MFLLALMSPLPGSSVAFPKPIQRAVASLGHVVDKFMAARASVLRRLIRAGQEEALRPWLPSETPTALPDDGLFAVALTTDDERLRVRQLFASSPAPALIVPAEARLPVWPALFKLQMLRAHWALEMRSNLLESLDAALPVACLLDPTPLPPGAVIGGLELASWEGIDALRASGRSFVIEAPARAGVTLARGDTALDWGAALRLALGAYPQAASVITETTGLAGGRDFTAVYQKKAGRVDLHSIIESPQ